MKTIILLGPAGSGKSFLAGALFQQLREHGFDALILNLDPAAITYPYEAPDISIRKYVRTERVMRRFGLGPNGALIASMDIAVKFAKRLRRDILAQGPEILIVDTPGQLEIFVFRRAGEIILKESILSITDNRCMALFLFDPFLCDNSNSMLSLLLLAMSAFLRIRIPMIGALTKIDLLSHEEKHKIWNMLNNPKQLLASEDFDSVFSAIKRIDPRAIKIDVWPVSSVSGEGLEAILMKIEDILGEE
ncbi:MAG: ATP/GTP-binding protein [Candidatus Njordarchaeota archaeon]